MIRSVLFDLDGTLADTAPDLAAALNNVRVEQGLKPLPLETIRCEVSNGANALTRLGFELDPGHPKFEALRLRLLDHYAENIAEHSRLFDGMDELLNCLEQQDIAWGIVTNKPKRFTESLVEQLKISSRAACIISGDTLEKKKPNPEPIYHACDLIGCKPHESIYVGDAQRDIEAGNRAGCYTIVALFGYIQQNQSPHKWGADASIDHPLEILQWTQKQAV